MVCVREPKEEIACVTKLGNNRMLSSRGSDAAGEDQGYVVRLLG
jgi:hypothetical protein